jgi:hypothetical protein
MVYVSGIIAFLSVALILVFIIRFFLETAKDIKQ